jgi:hypothetical protein
MIKSRKNKWARLVAHIGEAKNAYRILEGRPQVKT